MDALDRYYTPESVADKLLLKGDLVRPFSCADSACGEGSLLFAARRRFGDLVCIGLDKDRFAIQRLRRREPDWILSVADVLAPRSVGGVVRERVSGGCDLLTLNPPFSSSRRRSVLVEFNGLSVNCSIAMAHVLRSIEVFNPKHGALAIVPESFLYSDIDRLARECLGKRYGCEILFELSSNTFRGGKAHASAIRIVPSVVGDSRGTISRSRKGRGVVVSVVRGTLPVFRAVFISNGVPYCHSTDIEILASGRSVFDLSRVCGSASGVVSGDVILIPRVGLPRRCLTRSLKLLSPVQLSDCVIALKFSSDGDAFEFSTLLSNRWEEFVGLYRGTGARYVIVDRLVNWLRLIGSTVENL